MMDNLQKYKPTDKMIDLISDNHSLLQVMSRFGLSLGFGDKTVKEVFTGSERSPNKSRLREITISINQFDYTHRRRRFPHRSLYMVGGIWRGNPLR